MLKHMQKTICCLLASLALGACASTPEAAGHSGILRLKGNAPFVQAVLEDAHGKQWALEGVSPEAAQRLQNQRVRLQASPGRHVPPQLPVLQVRQIEAEPTR